MLSIHNISKIYDGHIALDTLTLKIQAARTTVLIGPSGCGKSTLLRTIIGLVPPDGGHIIFENMEVTSETALQLRHRMGYVIQDGGLFPHLTGYDNVALMARYLGWEEAPVDARIRDLTELTRFPEDSLQRYPVQLSGGQRQRVSLMRALMLDPDVLLLDEPLGALDPIIRADLQDDLREIFRTLGKTVVMVTHDMGEAAFFGDEIILMQDGRIIQQGTLHDMIHNPTDEFVTRFINIHRSPLDVLNSATMAR